MIVLINSITFLIIIILPRNSRICIIKMSNFAIVSIELSLDDGNDGYIPPSPPPPPPTPTTGSNKPDLQLQSTCVSSILFSM